uniref:Uncharacterized protein n=1 Tax=Lepeophtheirus salmonis TaxID=72036 RepID=A0A0K2UBJ2_LEPSM
MQIIKIIHKNLMNRLHFVHHSWNGENTPRSDGLRPAQCVFSYSQRTRVPALFIVYTHLSSSDFERSEEKKREKDLSSKKYYDRTSTN